MGSVVSRRMIGSPVICLIWCDLSSINTLCNTAVERCSGSVEQPANNPGYNGGDWAADASPHEQSMQTKADSAEQPTKNAARNDVEQPGNYSANAEIAMPNTYIH